MVGYHSSALVQVAEAATDPITIVVKSTVPVGTCDEIAAITRKANPSLQFAVVSNPEFLREGSALQDFREPDRIVVGTSSVAAGETMRELYASFVAAGVPLVEALELG
ncbi:MAG: hypothetical protein HC783_12975 [Rhodobacteraceae bacterium]|nr:hypothetical protein [Paracoccaceae bacterium]